MIWILKLVKGFKKFFKAGFFGKILTLPYFESTMCSSHRFGTSKSLLFNAAKFKHFDHKIYWLLEMWEASS